MSKFLLKYKSIHATVMIVLFLQSASLSQRKIRSVSWAPPHTHNLQQPTSPQPPSPWPCAAANTTYAHPLEQTSCWKGKLLPCSFYIRNRKQFLSSTKSSTHDTTNTPTMVSHMPPPPTAWAWIQWIHLIQGTAGLLEVLAKDVSTKFIKEKIKSTALSESTN